MFIATHWQYDCSSTTSTRQKRASATDQARAHAAGDIDPFAKLDAAANTSSSPPISSARDIDAAAEQKALLKCLHNIGLIRPPPIPPSKRVHPAWTNCSKETAVFLNKALSHPNFWRNQEVTFAVISMFSCLIMIDPYSLSCVLWRFF